MTGDGHSLETCRCRACRNLSIFFSSPFTITGPSPGIALITTKVFIKAVTSCVLIVPLQNQWRTMISSIGFGQCSACR